MLVLDSHDATSPLAAECLVLVELLHELVAEGSKILEIFLVDLSECEARGRLLVHNLTEGSLSAHKAEGNFLLAAEGGQVDNRFDGVHIVSNHNELCLVLLDESGHVRETKLDIYGLGALVRLLCLCGSLKAQLFVLLSLGGVLRQKLEELVGLVLVKSVLELRNGWWYLKTLHEDGLLALDTHVTRPLHETRKIALGLNVTTDTEVLGALLEEGVLGVVLACCGTNNDALSFNLLLLDLSSQRSITAQRVPIGTRTCGRFRRVSKRVD